MINDILTQVNELLYGWLLIAVLVTGGLYFSFRTGFGQLRTLPEQFQSITEKNEKGVSPFQTLMVSTASRVGTGNIVGVSTALCLGGFGSVFWMWVIAILGGATAFVESTLAQIYKKRGKGSCYGGPAYYIEACCKSRLVAIIFSVLLIITYGVGFNMLASYNLQSTFQGYGFYHSSYSPWIIGGITALAVGYCLFGGGRRIMKVTQYVVPVMGVLYILVAQIITFLNLGALPGILARIFREAFDFRAIGGGLGGSCLIYGIKRGLFSNEAGVGSAPNAAASAEVSHPAKQGLAQILSVFIDTLLICTATAFMCMASGVEPSPALSGAPYVQAALKKSLGSFGPVFITVSMALFAFTTLIGNLFYVDKGIRYVIGRDLRKKERIIVNIISSLVILFGAVLSAELLWNLSDIAMGLMTLINMPVLFLMGKYAIRALKNYLRQIKTRKDPTFCTRYVGITERLDYWQE